MVSKLSVSDPITITPAVNLSADSPGFPPAIPAVTFLGPPLANSSQPESEHSRSSAKRPRAGSCSTSGIQPPPKFGVMSSLIRHPSAGQRTDSAERDTAMNRKEYHSTSAVESKSDPDVVTDSAGSTIAQALNPKPLEIHCESSDTDSSFAPIRFQRTSKYSTFKPSGGALIKEYFAGADRFFFPKGQPLIFFTVDQVSTVLKVVAEENARSTQLMLEGIYQTSQ